MGFNSAFKGLKTRGRCGADFFLFFFFYFTKKFLSVKKPNFFDIRYNCVFILNHLFWQSHCSYSTENKGVLRNERLSDEIKKGKRGGF